MTRRYLAPLAALLLGLATLSTPAPASAGNMTMVLTPRGDAANLLQTGLQIYSMVEQQKGKKKNHAKVDQKGSDNAAALQQTGAGNYGLVVQRGKGHTATVSQDGYNNALGVFQFGKNADLSYVQSGNGKTSVVLQGVWSRATLWRRRAAVYTRGQQTSRCRPLGAGIPENLHQLPADDPAGRRGTALRSSRAEFLARRASSMSTP